MHIDIRYFKNPKLFIISVKILFQRIYNFAGKGQWIIVLFKVYIGDNFL